MYISGPLHLFLEQGRDLFKYKDHSVNLTPLASAKGPVYCSVLLLGYDKYERMLYSNSCSCQHLLLDGWEMRKDRKMLVVESLVKRGRQKEAVYPGNSKNPNPASVTAVVKSALDMIDV